MDSREAARIAGSAMTVSDRIRALAAGGYSRAEIARLLGKRYQHVRNVLEADKLREDNISSTPPPPGLQEPGATFGNKLRLEVDAGGAVHLPQHVLAALGSRPGGVLIAELEPDRLVISSHRANMARIDALMAPYRDPTRSFVDEFLAERRAEAAREDGDG